MRAKQSLRLMLGTVQFGMDYGIANKTGQPSYDQVRDILACAVEGGVNGLDTAVLVQAITNIVPDLPNQILIPIYWRSKT